MTIAYVRLPHPLARPCRIAFGDDPEATMQSRVWAVPFAAYQALRMACLPVIEGYLDDPIPTEEMPSQPSVASIADALERLRCPFFHDWVTALEALSKHVRPDRVGVVPALPLAEVVAHLKRRSWPALDSRYALRDPAGAPAHRALLGFRNGLAHGGGLPDNASCERLLHHYLPVLEDLLEAVRFLAECELRIREGDFDGEHTLVRILRGPDVPDARPLGDEEAWMPTLERHPVALRVPDGRVLPLPPLFALGSLSPVGLYDGHYMLEATSGGRGGRAIRERHVYYLGSGHDRWTDPSAVDELVQRLEARRVRWRVDKKDLAPWTIVDTLRYGTESTFGDLLGRKYFPECHVDREDLDSLWNRFLTADDPPPDARWPLSGTPPSRPAGLILVGAAGTGKTAWSCRVVERLLAEGLGEESGEAWSRDGRNLVLFLRGDMIPARSGREDRLLTTVLERMGLRDGDFASFDDLFAHLDRRIRDDRVPGRRLVIVLDALNEASPAPENLFREALGLVRAAARHPWVKTLVSIRQEFLGVLGAKAESQEKDIFFGYEPCLFHERPVDDKAPSRRAPVVDLRPLSEEEASEAHGRFQRIGLVDRPGCRTPWERLDRDTRDLLRNPLLLYVFHRHFGGLEAEPVRGRADLFRAYVEGLFREYPALEKGCRSVMTRLQEQAATELTAEDADALRRVWAAGRTPDEARLGLSPVESLVHAGLLRERSRHEGAGNVFVFESVLEYLLHDAWQARDPGLSIAVLQELVRAGNEASWPATYWNAFGFVFSRLLEEGRADDWPGLVNDESPKDLDAAAGRVWLSAAMNCGLASDAGEDALSRTPAGKVVSAFEAAGTAWAAHRLLAFGNRASDTRLPEWQAVASGAGTRVLEPLVASGRRELENELAMVYNNLGLALGDQGNLAGAVEAYGKAREIYARLVASGRRELENDLASVYNNLGAALYAQGNLAGAVEAYGKAREIRERLVASGRWQVLPDLCMTLYNMIRPLLQQGSAPSVLEAVSAVETLARRVRQEIGFGRLPAPWHSELLDVTRLAAGIDLLPPDLRDSLAELLSELERTEGRE